MAILQGHRGVCTEYPENTLTSVMAAIEQGYGYIELDPEVTRDGIPVLLHDATVGRTGRNADGSVIEGDPRISELTFRQALDYDFGIAFHKKFKGERIPKLVYALELAKAHGVKVKIDNKIWRFDRKRTEAVLDVLADFPETVALTCRSAEQIRTALDIIPGVDIHYDGEVNEEALSTISALVPRCKLTVWLPIECAQTSRARVPFATPELCALVKRYAMLGIWIVSEYADYDRAVNVYGADIIETNGQIKPEKSKGLITDMHSHTVSSHDAKSSISELCKSAIEKGIGILAVTDHFDGVSPDTRDPFKVALTSMLDIDYAKKRFGDKITLLKGFEYGEAFWTMQDTERVDGAFDFDVKLGSVHAVRYKDMREPFSVIDFSDIPKETVREYFDQYLDDMLENLEKIDFDVLTHLDNPMKYIKGKYGAELDMADYSEKIDTILMYIIKHGIALEINTATLPLYGDNMPALPIVKRWRELGGYLVTVGADSHLPEHVGRGIPEAIELIRSLGLRNIFYYKNRRSHQISI